MGDLFVTNCFLIISTLIGAAIVISLIVYSNMIKFSISSLITEVGELSSEVTQSKYESELQSRDCIRKLSDFISSHMWSFKTQLFDAACSRLNPDSVAMNEFDIISELITNDLQYKLLNNFTENHIGNTDEEIKIYTKIRSKEYMMRMLSIVEDYYGRVLSDNEFKVFIKELPEEFMYGKLYPIYHDGKLLEKSIKSEFNK